MNDLPNRERRVSWFNVELAAVALVAIGLIVVLPWMNTKGMVDNYTINLWGKYLCYALLAISVDLLWG